MIDPARINAVIFDFAGTLCSERYFLSLGSEALDAIAKLVFGHNSAAWAEPWMRGDLTDRDVAAYLGAHLPFSEDEIHAGLHQGCSRMTFNTAVHDFARRMRRTGRRTALVTANMDVFTEVVVPAHGLDSLFDLVLNTADHQTLDKRCLWRRAFDAFGPDYEYASALLIEDNPERVADFRSLGGYAYRYHGDTAFSSWVGATGLLEA
jgi:phosphoserine phosphatase